MIGAAFTARRERRGLTRAETCVLAGVSHPTLRRYEAGNLRKTASDAKEKLDALNKRWTLEDYEAG